MKSKVDTDALLNAISTMNSVVHNNFNSLDNVLIGLYNELEDEDSLHDCFFDGLETISNLQPFQFDMAYLPFLLLPVVPAPSPPPESTFLNTPKARTTARIVPASLPFVKIFSSYVFLCLIVSILF